VKNIEVVSRKFEKISWIISQTSTPRLKHDRIQTWWTLNILSKSMLEKVWWCRCFEMESWSRTICCPMNYSNEGKHAQVWGDRRSHVALSCCLTGKVSLLTCAKVLRKKRCYQP
jgi:hypothetical protein